MGALASHSPRTRAGSPDTVARYPSGMKPRHVLPWANGAPRMRNITGRVKTATVRGRLGVNSTVRRRDRYRADPNQLVAARTGSDAFDAVARVKTVRTARSGEALRGLALVPRDLR